MSPENIGRRGMIIKGERSSVILHLGLRVYTLYKIFEMRIGIYDFIIEEIVSILYFCRTLVFLFFFLPILK